MHKLFSGNILKKDTKTFPRPKQFRLKLDKTLEMALSAVGWEGMKESPLFSESVYEIRNQWKETIPFEGYEMEIHEEGTTIFHASPNGFHYGMQVLESMLPNPLWSCTVLEDAPKISFRGAMLDIGRDKIPKMETLYAYLDFLAELRYNHVEFYMEGFAFDFPKYRHLFPEETPLTGKEFSDLVQYAKARFIDLVPNQNCLGHMEQWLAKPQLNHLAECPEGFLFQEVYHRPPMTLNVSHPEVLELVQYFLREILPLASSDLVNVNLDEPFELGKNKERGDKEGSETLYLEYILVIHDICKSFGKRMMMWGDVIFRHPELISKIPSDVILLDWMYEGSGDFQPHCEMLQKVPHEFCLCPGTSSWASFAGRSDNMLKNINNAVENVVKYQGKGVLLTDWGDCGHWQYFTVSKIPFTLCGLAMWTGKAVSLSEVESYVNQVVFQEESQKICGLLFDLGNYYQLEEAGVLSTTVSFAGISSKYPFDSTEMFRKEMNRLLTLSQHLAKEHDIALSQTGIHFRFQDLKDRLDSIEKALPLLSLNCEDGSLVLEEIALTIAFIRHGAFVYEAFSETDPTVAELSYLEASVKGILEGHYQVWQKRNRMGGFARSSKRLVDLLKLYQTLKKNSLEG